MPNPNSIVSRVVRLEPPLDRAPAEMLRAEGGLSVELESERIVRLDPDNPLSVGFIQILDGLSKQRLLVYLEIDPATSVITRLLIPYVARVVGIAQVDDALAIELEPSHARHLLRRGEPDFIELESQLRGALQSRQPAILTEDDAHNIIDVRAFTPDPDRPMPPFPEPKPKFPPPQLPWPIRWIWKLLYWIWCWPWWPWWWFWCISMTRAQQVFNDLNDTSCDPLTVPAQCIPFLYPDDGCWARAHEMCRLMINMSLLPRKVWIDHSPGYWLHVSTRNNSACYVEWGWHVAPTLCVRGPKFFQTQRMVIDPSLFTTPVSEATWKGVQGDPNATLTDTDATQFWHSGGPDPTYSSTNYWLAYYRFQLQNRAIQVGPPPYANCP